MTDALPGARLYLDFGGALAALGLVFAVYQLRKPSWDVVLGIRPRWERNLFWILGIAGLILILAGILLDKFQPMWLPVWLRDSFWYQILAYISLAGSPISLFVLATRCRNLFTQRNAARFYFTLGWHTATGEEEEIGAVLAVLLPNFRSICRYASELEESEGRKYARFILDVILSDSTVATLMTTKRLDGLQHVFASAAEFGITRYYSPIGLPRLLRYLYANEDSFLYKQYQADGLALAMNIYETIFSSSTLLTNFKPFDYPALDYSMRKQIGATGIDVLLECLRRSVKTYLTTGSVPADHINQGLEYISEIFGDQSLSIKWGHAGQEAVFPRTPAWEVIDKIAHFLGHDLLFIAGSSDWNQSRIQSEALANGDGFASSTSITPAIAEALCEAFSQLSSIDKATNIYWSYQTVVELLHGLMLDNSPLSDGYRLRFEAGIWKRIRVNVVRRFFPATLRTYLEFIGFLLVFKGSNQGQWLEGQKDRMRRLLYVDLKPLLDRGEKMINEQRMQDALLPQVMRYDHGKFYYRGRFGEGEESEINEPPAGAESALVDVEDEYGGIA